MNTVCEVCGHIGFKRLLVCCRDCECSAAHQYCLDKVVFDASLADWLCYECLQRHGEVTCSRSLERVSSERSPSHAHFGSTVHQPITKRVESARDALPWGNKHAHQNKYWEVASLRNSKDKSEAHGDNNSNVIDGLTLEREKEEVIFQLDYRARNELPQRRMAAHVPQSSTLQNDAVAGIKNTPSVLERSVDSVDISSICQHDTTESSESSERFAECQKGTSCHRRKTVKMATTSSSSEESGEDIPSENKSLEPDNLQAFAEADYVLSRTRFLSEAQKERVVTFIHETQPGITVFVAVMRTSNVQPPGPSLIVPNRFLKHFVGKLSGTIKLQSPNGSVFDVKVTERYNKIVLRNGWKAFVYAHHIEESDSLLFRHIEKSCFEVLIFDSDGCEKVFSCSGIKSTLNFQERSVDYVDISSSSHYETTESSESERFARSHKGSSCHRGNTAKMAAISSSSEESEDTPSENESFESDDLHAPPRADYVLSHRSYLSEAQNERVIALIQEIEPEITVFVAIMRKSHVQPPSAFLAISTEYAFAHFPHESTNVTLQRPGKSKKWHPKFYKRKEISVYMLRGQWIDFVRDNHVQEGDICLLLPTKGGRKFTFTVHLLRAATAHSRGGTGFRNVSSCHGRLTTKMASAVHIKEEPTDGEHVSLESDVHGLSHGSLENKDSGGPFEPPYVISRKSCLSQTQKKIIEEKVRAIQCEVPIYVAILNKSSVTRSCELELSARYAGANLPDRSQSVVLHWMGKAWKTQMVIRNGSRWFLCGGWSKFVCDNGLRVGDICLFELKKNERKLTMMVHIIFS